MDTRAAAEAINTDPKTLRRFLRSNASSFAAVGSGGRYEFQPGDMAVLQREFAKWHKEQTPRSTTPVAKPKPATDRHERDRAVWAEEGPVFMPDIRDPRVRAMVRAEARRQELELEERLMAVGLHLSQRPLREHA